MKQPRFYMTAIFCDPGKYWLVVFTLTKSKKAAAEIAFEWIKEKCNDRSSAKSLQKYTSRVFHDNDQFWVRPGGWSWSAILSKNLCSHFSVELTERCFSRSISVSKSKITGWILSGLLSAFLILASASGKVTQWEGKAEMFGKLGWTEDVMFTIGIVEVAIAILFLIPRTAFVGAILLSAYLGGAVVTHVRVADPYFVPIIIGVVAWVALGLRDPRVFNTAFESNSHALSLDTRKT